MFRLFCLLFCFSLRLQAQPPPIRNLVFEGAGMRGIAYCGAINTLSEQGMLSGVQRVGGTSAGAITALLLSLGYSPAEITGIIRTTRFWKFNDGNFFFIGGINRLRKYFGWYRGKRFNNWVSALIAAKTGDGEINFSEMHRRGFKDLYITGTCLNRQQPVIFSYEHYPLMKVKDAVRISVSIPFYFEPVYMDSLGKVVDRPRNRKDLDLMIDGGLVTNFPIQLFDSTRYMGIPAANEFRRNPGTIGFRIDREEQMRNDQWRRGLATMEVTDLKSFGAAFYNMLIENLNRPMLTEEDWKRTIAISDGGVGPRIRRLSSEEVEVLLHNGAAAAGKYLMRNRTMEKKPGELD